MNLETSTAFLQYAPELEAAIRQVQAQIERLPELANYSSRWLAIKLLEQDSNVTTLVSHQTGSQAVLAEAQQLSARLARPGEDLETQMSDARYGWVNEITREVVIHDQNGLTQSERIDRIVTHRWLGLPIFLLVMYALFRITSEVPAPLTDWLEQMLNGPLMRWVTSLVRLMDGGHTWMEHLITQGILPGVGGVIVFVPVLATLYLVMGLLEDSGYMSRAAFVVDRLMHSLGLHGKSALPMIVGFGCTVPAIYATRTMNSRRERILTSLLVPFMSCGARLPVYVLFASIFFPRQAGVVIFSLYLGGILVAVLVGLLANRLLFRNVPPSPFLMELPAYHKPIWKNIWKQTLERTSGFLQKAGTTILACSILIWLLMAIPLRGEGQFTDTPIEHSAYAVVSEKIAPVFAPLGFGNWQMSGSLITGLVAKEVIVSSLAQTFSTSGSADLQISNATDEPISFTTDLADAGISLGKALWNTVLTFPKMFGIQLTSAGVEESNPRLADVLQNSLAETSGGKTTAAALAFLTFVLLYTPCASALAVERHELGFKWMLLTALGQFFIAWAGSFVVFQISSWIL